MIDKMNKTDAYYIVYKDLTEDIGLFTGVYDAKNGKPEFMHGIATVMEYIAYQVGDDCYNAFSDMFADNMIKSEEKARQAESTGSPIGDYRDGVGAWQIDCNDRYAVRTDSGEVVAYACPLGCEQTDCGWRKPE